MWEAGVRYSGKKSRLEVSYNYEHEISTTVGIEYFPNSISGLVYPEWSSSLHHLDIRYKVIDIAGATWRSGLNVTLLHSTMKTAGDIALIEFPIGDLAPAPWSWTGGWVNRIRVKDFSAGLDLLYHFNESNPDGFIYEKRNSVATPNIYLGYELHMARTKALEVYIESRDLIMSANSDVTDPRRYYTIGGKLTM
jgi:hypothetical protein